MIFRQIVFYSLLVGGLAGLVLTVVQQFQVIPIIQQAETFENPAAAVAIDMHLAHHDHGGHMHSHDDEEWTPADGLERSMFTLLSNVLTAVGFGLFMLVGMLVFRGLGHHQNVSYGWRHGVIWGAAGFVIFWLAPAIGLPPEIPMAEAAPLEARQFWWLMTVVCTAGGIVGIAFSKSSYRWTSLVLPLMPHVFGAPHPEGAMFASQSPEVAAALELLAGQFVYATALANAVFWLVLGVVSAWSAKHIVASFGVNATSNSEPQSV